MPQSYLKTKVAGTPRSNSSEEEIYLEHRKGRPSPSPLSSSSSKKKYAQKMQEERESGSHIGGY